MTFFLLSLAAAQISDLTVSDDFLQRALVKQHEHFWTVIDSAAQDHQYGEAVEGLYVCLEELPSSPVTKLLSDALAHLKKATEEATSQGGRAADTASAALSAGPGGRAVRGPSDFFAAIYSAFVAEEKHGYLQKLRGQVEERQKRAADILKPSESADVLLHTREAKKLAFDAMKYDIYNPNVPKTPELAFQIADKIVEIQNGVRKDYLGVVTAVAKQLGEDASSTDGRVKVEVDEGLEVLDSNKITV
jgi:hypothetical protein